MQSKVPIDKIAKQIESKYGEGSLIVIWRYDGKTSRWESYDSTVPEELNDLTAIQEDDKLWVEILDSGETFTWVPLMYVPPVLTIIPPESFTQETRRGSTWSGQISKEEVKELLIERFGPVCWGCGFEARRPNGSLDLSLMEVDHIRAKRSAEGTRGDDELYNLAILHRSCNLKKSNKMSLEELRKYNAENGFLYVDSINELVDLFEVVRYSVQELSRRAAKLGEGAFLVLEC